MLLDLTLGDLKGQNLDRTSFSRTYTYVFIEHVLKNLMRGVFNSGITFICP